MKAKYQFRYILQHTATFLLFCIASLFFSTNTHAQENQAPIVEQLSTCTQPMTPVIICMEGEDLDGDNVFIDEEETHTLFNCSLTFLSDSCFQYIPLPGMTGTDTVYVVQCDDATPSLCSTSEVYVTIGCEAPGAANDNIQISSSALIINGITIETNTALQGAILTVTGNDSDPCNDDLLVTEISNSPSNGTANVVLGQVSYIPNEGFSGQDVLEYVVCNDCPKCDTATVVIDVTADINCNEDFSICIAMSDTPEICPEFCEIPLEDVISIMTSVPEGAFSNNLDNCFIYTPPVATSNLETTAMFVACDANDFCDTTYVNISIAPDCGIQAPIAMDDTVAVSTGETVNIGVLNNDTEPDGQALTITNIITPPDCGNASIGGSNIIYTAGTDCNENQTITYEVCDPTGLCDTATVFVEIEVIEDCDYQDAYCVDSYQKVEICVEFCDLENASVQEVIPLFPCSIEILNDSCFTYIPLPGFVNTDTLRVIGCNPQNVCDTLIILAHVDCTSPVSQNDAATVISGENVDIDILANDNDPCSDELNTAIITPAENGTATINEDGSMSYTSNNGFDGMDTITYIACNDCDEGAICDTADVIVNVLPNETDLFPPIAQDDNITTNEEEATLIFVLDNDSDPDNDITELILTITGNPSNGTLEPTGNNAFTYTPNEGFTGTDTFTYQICDPDGQCNEATVTITVEGSNEPQAPIATDDTVTTAEGTPVSINVLDNDNDPDNETAELTLTATSNPSNGTIERTGNTFTYTPNEGFTGTDTFTYQICDPDNQCDEATVTITINEDTLPMDEVDAEPDLVYTLVNQNIIIPILANDSGEGIEITQILSPASSGIILNIDPSTGTVTYMPNPEFVGTDYFIYQICNPQNVCDTTLVTIIVQPENTENLPPNANNDETLTEVNTPVNIDAANNDTDPNNDPLTITDIIQDPSNGTITIEDDGTVTYTPNTDFVGCDAFAYNVCDEAGLCDIGIVSVTVGTDACVHPPMAEDDEDITFESTPIEIAVLDNDTDPENEDADPNNNQILTATLLSDPSNGIIVPIGETGFTYIPNNGFVGLDYFMYMVCDDGIPILCDTAYVTITVLPSGLNAEPDIVYTPMETPVDIAVLTNDSGEEIHVTDIISNPSNGTITVTPGTDIVTYTPSSGFVGTDYFEYQICDNNGNCDITVVTIIVLSEETNNTPPNAVNDLEETTLETPVTIDVLANDSDPFGGTAIILTTVGDPSNGTVTPDFENGTVVYTPNPSEEGFIDSFTYVICDNGDSELCDTATVVVTVSDIAVTASNLAPIAVDDEATTELSTPVDIPVLGNDFDPDGNNSDLDIVLITNPIGGTAMDEDGVITYTPNTGFSGTDFFTYVICDQGTPPICDTAYVTITVTGDIAGIDTTTQEETPVEICLEDYIADFTIANVVIISQPDNGTVGSSENANCVIYDPDVDFTGNDIFTVDVCDDQSSCIPVNITVEVTPLPDPPIAVNDTVNTLINTPIVIEVLENDSDPDGEVITGLVILDGPFVEGATATVDFGLLNVEYIPATDFVGIDSFQYLITDPTGRTDTAWAFITIDSMDITPPIEGDVAAIDDIASTIEGTPVEIPILDNDILPADSLVASIDIRIIEPAISGTALEGDTSVLYTPDLDFVGVDSFQYELCVAFINDSVACDTALVVVTVGSNSCSPKFANTFSPNGDNINELFEIEGLDACFDEEFPPNLLIFNRWGDMVYQIDNYDNTMAWDGTWQENNEDVPDGTYFYIFTYQVFEGEQSVPRQMTGFVEVCR